VSFVHASDCGYVVGWFMKNNWLIRIVCMNRTLHFGGILNIVLWITQMKTEIVINQIINIIT